MRITEWEKTVLLDRETLKGFFPKRKRDTHKGDYGKAAIVAGSMEYTGAAYLSTAACLRSGAGYTVLFTPEKILPYYVLKAPEALLVPLNDGGRVAFSKENFQKLLSYTSIAYGMGVGKSADVAKGAEYLIKSYTGKLLLDADALNSLAEYSDLDKVFSEKACEILLTPHVKEFSRLCKKSVEEIINDPIAAAVAFAKKHFVSVLLKSATSIITDGERIAVNTAGTAGQAKAGSGDVLSGTAAGLCACGLSAFEGGCAAAYLTGKAAELAVKETGEYSLLPTDVIDKLGKAFLYVTENTDNQSAQK